MKKNLLTMKFSFTLVLALLYCLSSRAQSNSSKIEGKVVDGQNKPLDYVSISLVKSSDSSLVKSAYTDANGKFIFLNMPSGAYKVSVYMLGYKKLSSQPFILENNGRIDLGIFTLSAESKALKEVTITAQKPFIERKLDRLVLNVESSTVAAGSTAYEVLQKAPGVTIDNNDNIAMQGKQGVMVMLDGKQTYMSSADLANLLKNTQSSELESIELITNPSSKYDAAGNSGIINIKLKKNKNYGTNGTLTAGAGYGENFRSNTGVSLNNRTKAINVFGNYNYSYNKRGNLLEIDRINSGTSAQTYFGQSGTEVRRGDNNNFKAGADYFINKNNTLGLMVSGYLNNGNTLLNNHTQIGRSFSSADSSITSINDGDRSYKNFAYNLNYKSTLDTAGQEISVDLDYSNYSGADNMLYDNRYFKPSASGYNQVLTKNGTPSSIDIKSFKADYTLPVNKTVKFEAGLKSSVVKADNTLDARIYQNANWINNPLQSNQFIYEENINAAYVNLSKQFKKTSVQAGLRAENTISKGNSITTSKVVKRNYIDFFPTLFVNQSLSKNHDLGLSYSRRINRPNYDDLNPFLFFLDQYTYNQGNPFLTPQYSNSFEASYTYKKRYSMAVNYTQTNDVIMEVVLPDTARKALYQTKENLDRQNNYSISGSAPFQFTKWWSSNNNIVAFYSEYKSKDLRGKNLDNASVAMVFNTTQSITLGKFANLELSGFYQSPLYWGTLKIGAQYAVDGGLSKSFANKRANVKVGVSDIFNTRENNISSAYDGLTYSLHQKSETRIAKISLSYRFGRNEIKPSRRRSTGLEQESNRLKN